MTNGDRVRAMTAEKIRAMSDEELTTLILKCPYEDEIGDHCSKFIKKDDEREIIECDACKLEWLKSEVKESEQG